ncbi:MAG: GAF domain-containing protein [Candidatus Aminicenantes bacterium]|nr:GAF domain-containing protein [Candidatus Aminicenantes bacterium]
MNDINVLVEELRTLVATSELSAEERFRVAMNRMADFLAAAFGGEKDEVAVLWKHKKSLAFLWPDFLAEAKELPVKAKLSIAANILRSGQSFLDNRLIEREHMVEYEFVKESNGGSRLIWKMMGAAITVDGKRLGVVQISRKRSVYNEPGPDFTPADLEQLEKLTARLGSFLKAVIPF